MAVYQGPGGFGWDSAHSPVAPKFVPGGRHRRLHRLTQQEEACGQSPGPAVRVQGLPDFQGRPRQEIIRVSFESFSEEVEERDPKGGEGSEAFAQTPRGAQVIW